MKKNHDSEDLKSYRPISKTSYLSKLIELSFKTDLMDFVVRNSLLPDYQSAYRKSHSTETALLKIYNDLLLSLDNGKSSLLVLLDSSAAYDTVSHKILLEKLRNKGIGGNAQMFLSSYLENELFALASRA